MFCEMKTYCSQTIVSYIFQTINVSLNSFRSRDLSPRQPSMESTRQCSLDSTGAATVTAGIPVKRPPSPPCSPSIASSHHRKKFRRISGAGSASSGKYVSTILIFLFFIDMKYVKICQFLHYILH